MQNRAQGAIEYLLIIGAAILVVAIVIIAVTSVVQQGQVQDTTAKTSQSQSVDALKEASGEYYRINGNYYIKSTPTIGSGLVGLWHLDDNSVAIGPNYYKDSSGKGKDANCVGITTAPCPITTTGIIGSGQKLAGATALGEKLITPDINLGTEHTLSIWVNFTSAPSLTNKPILFTGGTAYSHYFNVLTTAYVMSYNGITRSGSTSNVPSFVAGRWYNIVLSRKGNDLNYFINGSRYPLTATGATYFILNKMGNPYSVSTTLYAPQAIIDEIAVWNVALSYADVNKLYFGK